MTNSEALLQAAERIRSAVLAGDDLSMYLALSFAFGVIAASPVVESTLKQSAATESLYLTNMSGTPLIQTSEAVYTELRKAAA